MNFETKRQYQIDESIYATTQQRLTNLIIDYIIRFLGSLVLITGIAIVTGIMGNHNFLQQIENMNRLEELLFSYVIVIIYYNTLEILFGISIGKLVTGTVVVDLYGEKPAAREIFVRTFCRIIPFEAISFLGTPGKGWHDTLSKTYVVQRKLLQEQKENFNSLDQIGQNNF